MGRTACTEPQYLYKGAIYLFYLKYYSNNQIMEHGARSKDSVGELQLYPWKVQKKIWMEILNNKII
jgi:hypothetical protein